MKIENPNKYMYSLINTLEITENNISIKNIRAFKLKKIKDFVLI